MFILIHTEEMNQRINHYLKFAIWDNDSILRKTKIIVYEITELRNNLTENNMFLNLMYHALQKSTTLT